MKDAGKLDMSRAQEGRGILTTALSTRGQSPEQRIHAAISVTNSERCKILFLLFVSPSMKISTVHTCWDCLTFSLPKRLVVGTWTGIRDCQRAATIRAPMTPRAKATRRARRIPRLVVLLHARFRLCRNVKKQKGFQNVNLFFRHSRRNRSKQHGRKNATCLSMWIGWSVLSYNTQAKLRNVPFLSFDAHDNV